VDINWTEADGERYSTELKIYALDRVGLLNDITAVFSAAKTNITGARIKSLRDKTATIDMTVDVPDIRIFNDLLTKVGNITDVLRIERVSAHRSLKSK
ncbi:MAG: ACT domain-containing protein, partial [Armatimonadetes bacterium]|nr:ACT domain-containing protein [Armatimonadota bacterium]